MTESGKAFIDFVHNMKLDTPEHRKDCKGKVYRASVNTFVNPKGDIVHKESFRFLRRSSCGGCEKCSYLDDDLHEELACGHFEVPADVKHGALYRLATTNVGYDYETGICDSWDTELILIK